MSSCSGLPAKRSRAPRLDLREGIIQRCGKRLGSAGWTPPSTITMGSTSNIMLSRMQRSCLRMSLSIFLMGSLKLSAMASFKRSKSDQFSMKYGSWTQCCGSDLKYLDHGLFNFWIRTHVAIIHM